MNEKQIALAKAELNEPTDDVEKQNAIKELRNQLENHPFIVCSRLDEDDYMTMLLRNSKYNIKQVVAEIEGFAVLAKKFPHHSCFNIEECQRSINMLDDGVILLLGQDSESRFVLLINCGKIDSSKGDSFTDLIRLMGLIFVVMREEEDAQFAGFILIYNIEGLTLQLLPTLEDIRFSASSSGAELIKVSKMLFMKVPAIFMMTLKLFKKMSSEKITKNLVIMGKNDSLDQYVIPKSILPRSHGGDQDVDKLIQNMKDLLLSEKGKRIIDESRKLEILTDKMPQKRWYQW